VPGPFTPFLPPRANFVLDFDRGKYGFRVTGLSMKCPVLITGSSICSLNLPYKQYIVIRKTSFKK